MLVTRDFVFVHIPRTGGTFLRGVLWDHAPVLTDGGHVGAQYIPEKFSELPVFAVIRNPWDWYVSWFHWVTTHPEPDDNPEQWQELFGAGRYDFPEALRAHLNFRPDSDYYSVVWADMFRSEQERGRAIDVGHFETLRDDFVAFLDRHDVPGEELRRAVLEDAPVFQSERNGYRDYYDDDLRDLVGERAQRIVSEYDYTFS